MAKPKVAQVGDIVLYQGRSGALPAMVLMTPETFDADKAGYEAPAAGSVSLLVFRISGRTYVRHGVPQLDSDAYKALVDAKAVQQATDAAFAGLPSEGFDEDEAPAKPVVVRSWTFKA
jgi:hypothetical protein